MVQAIVFHPYSLVVYGILLWQIEQSITKGFNYQERSKNLGKSLVWGSLIVIFDDEAMEFIQEKLDIVFDANWYFYLGGGFFVDIIRSKISKEETIKKQKEEFEAKTPLNN